MQQLLCSKEGSSRFARPHRLLDPTVGVSAATRLGSTAAGPGRPRSPPGAPGCSPRNRSWSGAYRTGTGTPVPAELERLHRLEGHVQQIDTTGDPDAAPDPRYDHRVTTLEQRVAAKVVELTGSYISVGCQIDLGFTVRASRRRDGYPRTSLDHGRRGCRDLRNWWWFGASRWAGSGQLSSSAARVRLATISPTPSIAGVSFGQARGMRAARVASAANSTPSHGPAAKAGTQTATW